MRKLLLAFTLLLGQLSFSQNQDSLGLPGDNLNLYAVLDAFRESETLEIFEKKLNTENNKINNLDLNNDDKTDFIKVLDSKDGDSHLITLQVDISKTEKQDVAVITVDKDASGKMKVQIVGDPELYGKNYIIEPDDNNSGKTISTANLPEKTTKTTDTIKGADGKTVIINNVTNNYYNSDTPSDQEDNKPVPPVTQWVIVNHIYSPGYVMYVSPWYWSVYPPYWNPWVPIFWHQYYWHYHYHHYHHHHFYYHYAPHCYSKAYPGYYGQRRSVSSNFGERKVKGEFNKTYSRPDLGKPQTGRPNPGFKGPLKNSNNPNPEFNPQKNNMPPKPVQPKPNPRPNGPPPQKLGPKPGGAPIQKSSGGVRKH